MTRMSQGHSQRHPLHIVVLVFLSLFSFLLSLCTWSGTCTPAWARILRPVAINFDELREELAALPKDARLGTTHSERFNYYEPAHAAQKTIPLKIMTWNVERAGPDLFLPKREQHRYEKSPEWYNRLWNLKLRMIAKVVLLHEPDVLFLNEVSLAGMQHLMEAVFRPLGYSHSFFDAAGKTDFNGMGNAVVSKTQYPILDTRYDAPKSFPVLINGIRPDTRNIMRWQIAVGKRVVTFLGLHFRSPIPFNSEEPGLRDRPAHDVREKQVLLLKQLIRDFQEDEALVILGDANGPLPETPDLVPIIRVPEKSYLDMEAIEDTRRSLLELTTVSSPAQSRIQRRPHDPFNAMRTPTYVHRQFIPIQGTSEADGAGGARKKYMPPNEYPYIVDHILVVPDKHHVIEASENPTLVNPEFISDQHDHPKGSRWRIREDQLAQYYGPSDHFGKLLTLHINADE